MGMEGIVDVHDIRFHWELREGSPRGPARCTLHVAFGELTAARQYSEALTPDQAQTEAERLVPEQVDSRQRSAPPAPGVAGGPVRPTWARRALRRVLGWSRRMREKLSRTAE